ncbi:cilia- and flagella-associated protein 157-like [Oncorhynchus masou masou]|uniref:cilia- and flagella-associated protein 157-like n=1 Tax=Oncorhynchus masou masou TaxID=90313 RepID=UPI0031839867
MQVAETRLEKYQHNCDELEVQHNDFPSQYFTVEKDMGLYVKCLLARKEDELTDLSEQLGGLQQAKESFELQLSQLRQELQENKDKLTF